MGPGVDPKFDELLLSLGKIAQKNTKSVVDSVMRWRNLQFDSVPANIIRAHTTQSPGLNRSASSNRPPDASYVLNERKSLTAIYITCRTLISVLQSIGKDALGESMGGHLEDTTFKQFREPDLKLLTQSANHRINAELYATLLGHIASIRLVVIFTQHYTILNRLQVRECNGSFLGRAESRGIGTRAKRPGCKI